MNDIAATVISLAGAADAVAPGGEARALVEGAPVYPGEAVATGPAGAVLLSVAGQDGLHSIGPGTRWLAGDGVGSDSGASVSEMQAGTLPVGGGIDGDGLDSHAARESLFLADGRARGLVEELFGEWPAAPVAAPDLAALQATGESDPLRTDVTAGELLGVIQEALDLSRALGRLGADTDDSGIAILEAAARKVRGMVGPESPVDLLFTDENALAGFFEPLLDSVRGGESLALGRLAAEIPGGLHGIGAGHRVLFDEEPAEVAAQAAPESVAESAADMAHEDVLSLAALLESVTEENLSGVLTLAQDGAGTRVTVRGGEASAPGESSIWLNSGDPESGPWDVDPSWLRTGITGYEPDCG